MKQEKSVLDLLGQYSSEASHYDEMWDSTGGIRPHWGPLMDTIRQLGPLTMNERHEELQRLLRENGVTYNVYGDPEQLSHPWQLDPVPLLISIEDWNILEEGLKQRAFLLNELLKDLYTERILIKEGIVPTELIFSDPRFLLACDQLMYPSDQSLILYAADISRGPNGRIWVIGDRTQAPSGWGYTLENRTIMARALPELFKEGHVRKISDFFHRIQSTLSNMLPGANQEPRVVLLTPGPMNETYFEHAFLASLQGMTLVQGQDLMVKDNRVWLKTLSGLEQVDIIIRRVDDNFCDPLALKADSQLGVAGLLEVVRQKNVCIANPLGSGILENPGLLAFLPSISQFFLKEELLLPSIATWWCGQEKERAYVLENIDQLVIKKINSLHRDRTFFGWTLSKEKLEQLKKRIQQRPYLYVAQEQAIFSTAPTLAPSKLTPRHTVLRSFLVADEGRYEVMPGGLTRSAPKLGNTHVSNQSGGISKDTWIQSPEAHPPVILSQYTFPDSPLYKGIEELPSRTAENLYWVGRYAMRILQTARLLRSILAYQVENENFAQSFDEESLHVLLKSLTHVTMTYPGFVEDEQTLINPSEELRSIMIDPHRPGTLAFTINRWMQSANAVRDRWSGDTWRLFEQIETAWRHLREDTQVELRTLRNYLDQLISNVAAFNGLDIESMTGEEGRYLYDIGRRIEQGLTLTSLIRSSVVAVREREIEQQLIEVILASNDSLNTYRYRFRAHLRLSTFLYLLLLDISYPRSLAYILRQLQIKLKQLPETATHISPRLRKDQKFILEAFTFIQLAEAESLTKSEEGIYIREQLDRLLAHLSEQLAHTSDVLVQTYFTHIMHKPNYPVTSNYQDL